MSERKTKVYEMRRDGWTSYFELHVSPNPGSMRRHIAEEFKKNSFPLPGGGVHDTVGLVQPINPKSGLFAICFLNEERLGAGVVAHECLHVALAHERFVIHFGMNYGGQCEEHEERLAYFLTDCVKGVYDSLYEHGHIKPGVPA